MSQTAQDQVRRLLALVPYLREREGVKVEQVAKDFGVEPTTIVEDLNVLWFCGLPGAVTGDLIEIDMDALDGEGVVHLDNADYLSRPLRLDTHEALALIVGLRTLREVCGPQEREAVERALRKLEDAAGDSVATAEQVEVQLEPIDQSLTDALNRSLRERRRVHLHYFVPARDETTERDVDPMRLVTAEGHTYLEGWCYRAEDVRLFRLDRVAAVTVLDAPAAPPPQATMRDLAAGLFQPSPDDLLATLELSVRDRWVAEYYPMETVQEMTNGNLLVTLRVGERHWLRRLVLRLSGGSSLVSPVDLAEEIRVEATRALGEYDDPGADVPSLEP
jgi:proteasome accessory factor C